MKSLQKLTNDDYASLLDLMSGVWHQTYDSIVGFEHSEFLLHKYFDYQNVMSFVGDGFIYRFVDNDGERAGLVVYQMRQDDVYLDKLYVFENQRRKGVATFALHEIKKLGKDVRLNVNRNNKNAIATYEKCGFVVEKDVEISLPGGFVNYDYVMLYRQKGSDDGKFCMERSENKVIAGVCGGFAEHFKIDPTVVRAVYLLLTLCTAFCGVIVYIVMWILMPEKRKY